MELHELYQAFEQFNPTPQQEQAMLNRILSPQEEVKPMKKIRRVTAVAAAAALLLMACAFTYATGLDQRLLDYFGAGAEAEPLLLASAQSVELSVTDGGAALEVHQVLMDEYLLMVLADFTAPEGTVLDEEAYNTFCYDGDDLPCFLDEEGGKIAGDYVNGYTWETLADDTPLDNHITMLFVLQYEKEELQGAQAVRLAVPAVNLVSYSGGEGTELCSGDWSFEVPLPQQSAGWLQQTAYALYQDEQMNVTLDELYLSPMTLRISLARAVDESEPLDEELYQDWMSLLHAQNITLTTRDGHSVALTEIGGVIGIAEQQRSYRLTEITDPAQFQGGTITFDIDGRTVTLALDNLAPAGE